VKRKGKNGKQDNKLKIAKILVILKGNFDPTRTDCRFTIGLILRKLRMTLLVEGLLIERNPVNSKSAFSIQHSAIRLEGGFSVAKINSRFLEGCNCYNTSLSVFC